MASRKRTLEGKLPRFARNKVSWMAILAATTFGVDAAAATVHAEVRTSDGLPDLRADEEYRLIVQTYDRDARRPGAKPVGSIQRAVTAAELRQGVRIDLLELRQGQEQEEAPTASPIVVAWLERGRPDLEFDGRMARMPANAPSGFARVERDGERAYITLA